MDSTDPMGQLPQTWERMGPEQLRIYAQELAETYRKEQQLRQEVEAKNRELEQKLRELSALNRMFQKHLDIRFQVEDALKRLVDGIHRTAEEADEILRQTEGGSPLSTSGDTTDGPGPPSDSPGTTP